MKRIIFIFLLLSNILFAQSGKNFPTEFLLNSNLKPENISKSYSDFDFSNIWTQMENKNIFGIIGKDHQRIKIKLIAVFRISNNPLLYTVYGKSNVKNNICEFYRQIVIKEIRQVKELHYGVDDEYANKRIKSQGILIADYEFKENKEQKHSGIFKGKLYSKWYLNAKNKMEYDNIESMADSYTNNAFVGIWENYKTGKVKICNWADFRVPNANRDFDNGVGEFSPSKKYYDKGWENYQKAWLSGDEQAKKIELETWWK